MAIAPQEAAHPTRRRICVITPFFNTQAYLAECIQSVLAQTYSEFDYLLVDNHSSDASPQIAANFAAIDARIRIVKPPSHLSQVQNYNFALRKVTPDADFVKFVEADNWLFPTCLERMLELAQRHPSVGLVSALNATERTVRFTGLHRGTSFLSGREAARMHLLGNSYLFGSPTTVLLKADFIRRNSPFFDESVSIAEDLLACYGILADADFGFVHEVLTFVRTENDSILSRRGDLDAIVADRHLLLQRYGPTFLTSTEYSQALSRAKRLHYSHLACALLRRAESDYWRFHEAALRDAGESLDRLRLFFAVLREIAWRLSNPGRSLLSLFSSKNL